MTTTRPLIISAATPAYEAHLQRLLSSCERFGLDVVAYRWPGTALWSGRPAWMINCHMIAYWCRRAAIDYPDRHLVWIDADATIEREPTLFVTLAADDRFDVAVYHLPWLGDRVPQRQAIDGAIVPLSIKQRRAMHRRQRARPGESVKGPYNIAQAPDVKPPSLRGELADGTMWYRSHPGRVRLFERWIEEDEKRLSAWLATGPTEFHCPPKVVWEQAILDDCIDWWADQLALRVGELPDSYCRIFDCDSVRQPTPRGEATILHWQGSRQLSMGRAETVESSEAVLSRLPRPIYVVGNGPHRHGDRGLVGAVECGEKPGTVLRLNNWWKSPLGRVAEETPGARWAWVSNCWHDVSPRAAPVLPDSCLTLARATGDAHPVGRWERRYHAAGGQRLHVGGRPWLMQCSDWTHRTSGHGCPTLGLTLLWALRELGVEYRALCFSGRPPDASTHHDERRSLAALGVDVEGGPCMA